MKKMLITSLILAAVVVALIWAGESFDLMGALRRMHGR
jgi:hypothetical protein